MPRGAGNCAGRRRDAGHVVLLHLLQECGVGDGDRGRLAVRQQAAANDVQREQVRAARSASAPTSWVWAAAAWAGEEATALPATDSPPSIDPRPFPAYWSAAMASPDPPELLVRDAAAWRKWLDANHSEMDGVWLVLSRKGTLRPTRLAYADALEEALAHGWIDGQAKPRDEATYRQRFTPRRKRSRWSKRNTEIVERLTGEGRMHAAGHAEIERAKSDGRWQAAYEGPARSQVPDDLATALASEPAAKANFEILTSLNRYAILYRVHDAKRPETRERRIREFVAMLARGETPYPQKRKLPG